MSELIDSTAKNRLILLCKKALIEQGMTDEKSKKRLELELKSIIGLSEEEYFVGLIDKRLKFRNENNLLVAHLLGLCDDFDPDREPEFEYGEFPDIDIDYLPQVRDYLKNEFAPETFGRDRVCCIASYTTYGLKSSLIDMARVFGYDHHEITALTTKLKIKDDEGEALTWDTAMELYDELREYCDARPDMADAAKRLMNRTRGKGQHASGLIISSVPITDIVPMIAGKGEQPAAAWVEGLHGTDLGAVGLVKFDFLVLDGNLKIALTNKMVSERVERILSRGSFEGAVTNHCEELIRDKYGIQAVSALPGQGSWTDLGYLNDPKALAMANRAELRMIFQFDSSGIRKMVLDGGVTRFDDLVAYTALYRPGPMKLKYHERYCKRKSGEEEYEIHPKLMDFMESTYGVLCIHEDTPVSMADGREKPIRDVRRGDIVHSVNMQSRKVEPNECYGCGPTRFGKGIKLTLDNGYSVTLTPDHKVMTWEGMKEVQHLNPDRDLVAAPRSLPQTVGSGENLATWLGRDEDVAYLLGLITGDAQTKSSIELCAGSEFSCNWIMSWVKAKLPKLAVTKYHHCRSWYLRISCAELLNDPAHGNRKTKLGKLVDDLDMRGTCYTKDVPAEIMTANAEIRRSYLAGLWDSDGSWTEGTSGTSLCFFTSMSPALLNSVRKLLAMEGIVTNLQSNRVYVWDTEQMAKVVAPYMMIRGPQGKLSRGTHIGWCPKDEIRKAKEGHDTWNEFCEATGLSRQVLRDRGHEFSSNDTGEKCGIDFGDLRYHRIETMEEVADQQFYCMSVANNHNLVAAGICVSNCYQEQVMRMLNVVGLIPLKDCEAVRKAISKKKVEKFQKYKDMFIRNGKVVLGWTERRLAELWQQIEAFAGYGFNLSHAVAYTYISSRMLYMKAHFPTEFTASVMTCMKLAKPADYKKIKVYKGEAERMGVSMKPLNVNNSADYFRIIGDDVYWSFEKIRGIGEDAAKRITDSQPYVGFDDFLSKYGKETLVVQALIALNQFKEADRVSLYKYFEAVKKYEKGVSERAKRFAKSKEKMEAELAAVSDADPKERDKVEKKIKRSLAMYTSKNDEQPPVMGEEYTGKFKLDEEMLEIYADQSNEQAEKEYYGFRWSNPLARCPNLIGHTFSKYTAEGFPAGPIEVAIAAVNKKVGKKGTSFYVVEVEDVDGIENTVTVWEDEYKRFAQYLRPGSCVRMMVRGPSEKYSSFNLAWLKRGVPALMDTRITAIRLPELV